MPVTEDDFKECIHKYARDAAVKIVNMLESMGHKPDLINTGELGMGMTFGECLLKIWGDCYLIGVRNGKKFYKTWYIEDDTPYHEIANAISDQLEN